jgi:hypothetical protein
MLGVPRLISVCNPKESQMDWTYPLCMEKRLADNCTKVQEKCRVNLARNPSF